MTDIENFVKVLRGQRKVVINDCYGGFGLSKKARIEYCRLAGIEEKDCLDSSISRDDPYLVKVVSNLSSAANGPYSNLKIVEIPDDVEWIVQDYDGAEWIAEKHRTWS